MFHHKLILEDCYFRGVAGEGNSQGSSQFLKHGGGENIIVLSLFNPPSNKKRGFEKKKEKKSGTF